MVECDIEGITGRELSGHLVPKQLCTKQFYSLQRFNNHCTLLHVEIGYRYRVKGSNEIHRSSGYNLTAWSVLVAGAGSCGWSIRLEHS